MDATQLSILAVAGGCALAGYTIYSKVAAESVEAGGKVRAGGKKKKSKSKAKRKKNKAKNVDKPRDDSPDNDASSPSDVESAKENAAGSNSGKLSRNQRRKRNARARAAEKEKEDKEQKLKEKLNASKQGNKKGGSKKQNQSGSSSVNQKQKDKEAKKRWEEYQRDLADGWEVVGADKIQKPQSNRKKKKDRKAAAEKKTAGDAKAEEPTGPALNTARMEVEPRHYGKIIGSGGVTLKAIMEKSGAVIRMPRRDADPPSKIIIIEGTGDAVGLAKSAIHELVNKGYSRLINPEIAEGAISVEPKLHGLIIGPKGSNINAIKARTGVSITFPGSGSHSRRIQLSGTKAGIKMAKAAIKSLATYRYSPLLTPGLTHEEIPVPAEKMGLIIGPKASTRRHIEGNSKAKIHCPSRDDEKQNVIVVGAPAAVARAKKAILKILAKDAEPQEPEEEYLEEDPLDDDQPTDDIAAQYLVDTDLAPAAEEDTQTWGAGAPDAAAAQVDADAGDWE